MSDANAGIVLLTVVAIAFGGSFLLRVVGGSAPANHLQKTYFRAGHAHAGVLVILGLVVNLYMHDAAAAARHGSCWPDNPNHAGNRRARP